ncbi:MULTISPECIES: hypothetical protein [unclassified Thiocapsa]|uniref:hypothetical protein n=1 Tax=unclassified Thiocapsa TaxID=2641286 RepID=UPI0035B2799F
MDVGRDWVEIAAAGVAFEGQSGCEYGVEIAYGADQPPSAVAGLWYPGMAVFSRSDLTARAWARLPPTAPAVITNSNLRIFTGP